MCFIYIALLILLWSTSFFSNPLMINFIKTIITIFSERDNPSPKHPQKTLNLMHTNYYCPRVTFNRNVLAKLQMIVNYPLMLRKRTIDTLQGIFFYRSIKINPLPFLDLVWGATNDCVKLSVIRPSRFSSFIKRKSFI